MVAWNEPNTNIPTDEVDPLDPKIEAALREMRGDPPRDTLREMLGTPDFRARFCRRCGGEGMLDGDYAMHVCPRCHGTGDER
jgi:DnaJ-class molecular chaperone